jgi:predicted nucleic acid-binding protein
VGLIDDLGTGRVGVDTAVFIYFIEQTAIWMPIITPLFRAADMRHREIVTSAVTLLEVLVVPYRADNDSLAARYEALLTRSRGIRLVDVTRDLLRRAAQLRARFGVRTPDALQLSAALEMGCSAFVTNDRRLPVISGLRVVQLASYAA